MYRAREGINDILENKVEHQNSRFISFRNRPAKCLPPCNINHVILRVFDHLFFFMQSYCTLVLQFILYLCLGSLEQSDGCRDVIVFKKFRY